jgi:RNA polymerase sigma-70 factor (ECF subfamily)
MGSLANNWRECVRRPDDNSVWENLLDQQRLLLARIVLRVARRFGVTQFDEIDDAMQEACLKMSGAARQGTVPDQEDGALEAYLKAMMANTAHDYFRKRRAKRRDSFATTPIDVEGGRQLIGSDQSMLESGVFLAQIEKFVEGDSRDRDVFCLYYQQGWTAKEIASLPSVGLSVKGVESLVFRLTTAIRRRIQDSTSHSD